MSMAESSKSSGTAENEIAALKEVLLSQQKLLQKLYIELDEEREASGTSVSEALSMILRLQGEKAAVKMEASQYKRMAEEKIYHAEESIAAFEELLYQKDMEIACLEFQIQAYRCKLMSLGSSDMTIGEMRFPDHLLLRSNGAYFGDMGVHGTVKRNKSLPAILYKDSYCEKGIVESERSSIPLAEFSSMKIDEDTDREFNVRSKEMQAAEESAEYPRNLLESEAIRDTPHSTTVHDIFEVPQIHENHKCCGPQKKLILEGEADWLKKMLLYGHQDNKTSKLEDRIPVDCHLAPTIHDAPSQADVEQLRLELLEYDRRIRKKEGADRGEEEMKLLRKIHEQLNAIQSEISSKIKKSPPLDDSPLVLVMEVWLIAYFLPFMYHLSQMSLMNSSFDLSF
ncbi:hypothetical protein HHK36_021244 [Tetracentron sinense]|uniref:GTD-binding domain-containing protein n=1 Tax=Tetracentron sinense TaxID=13715 RepID=A0A835D6W8_TETSI|nr:hypothetical protein HHK36_021244 [Tetracentron sinense]